MSRTPPAPFSGSNSSFNSFTGPETCGCSLVAIFHWVIASAPYRHTAAIAQRTAVTQPSEGLSWEHDYCMQPYSAIRCSLMYSSLSLSLYVSSLMHNENARSLKLKEKYLECKNAKVLDWLMLNDNVFFWLLQPVWSNSWRKLVEIRYIVRAGSVVEGWSCCRQSQPNDSLNGNQFCTP